MQTSVGHVVYRKGRVLTATLTLYDISRLCCRRVPLLDSGKSASVAWRNRVRTIYELGAVPLGPSHLWAEEANYIKCV